MRVATARPRPETPPVTTARIESGCMRSPGKRKAGILTVMAECLGEAPAKIYATSPVGRLDISRRANSSGRRPGANRKPWPTGTPSSRSEEHTSELQSLMRISYAVFCLKKKKKQNKKRRETE